MHTKSFVQGWDVVIPIGSDGTGSATLVDNYNSFVVVQVISSPDVAEQVYKIDILNTDFNHTVFERFVQGKLNEFMDMPIYGKNTIRIREAVPAEGNITVAVRYK